MSGLYFEIDRWALIVGAAFILLCFLLVRIFRHYPKPYIKISSLQEFDLQTKTWKNVFANVPRFLFFAALAAWILAFLDPRFFVEQKKGTAKEGYGNKIANPAEGIVIYLILDQSGSMVEEVFTMGKSIRKMDLLKKLTADFVEERPSDMIGLVGFARGAQILSPLTLDHEAILDKLSHLDVVHEREKDGTAIGYAIFKTANLIAATRHYAQELAAKGKPAYEIKNSVIILVTDGLQDPNPLDKGKRLRNIDLDEAAQYAHDQGVRLYAVVVEPKLGTSEFAPYRHVMEKITALTGGKFFLMDTSTNLQQIYAIIDKLEKSFLPAEETDQPKSLQPDRYRRISFYPYLIAIGLLCFALALFLDTVLIRRVP